MYGNKIDNLIKLKNNNINIPDFIIVKFEDIVKDKFIFYNLFEECNNSKIDSKEISDKLKKLFDEQIQISLNLDLKDELYAVRSSSNIEDGIKKSFAGQFDTYLNVKSKDVNEKIKLCFKSLYNKNVIEYIKLNKIKISELKMYVLIQKMIQSELSGIIFTANPKGILNEIVITVGEGIGENVVKDKIDTTNYYYNISDKVYYYEGKKNYLNEEMIQKLADISFRIESILEKYLDIEFAIFEKKIYILQARKITTIDEKNVLILDNSNIVESYPGICLPLTCSFANIVYTGVFKGLCYRLLKDKKVIERENDIFSNMVGNVNGRMYYKISNWYILLKCLPFNKKIIPIWQEMLGIKDKSYDKKKVKITFKTRVMTYINFLVELFNIENSMKKLNEDFVKINEFFYKSYSSSITKEEIIKLYFEIKNKLLSIWDITLINDIYSFIYTGILKKILKKHYKNYESVANKYISSISNIESIHPIKELIIIAYEKDMLTKEEYEKRIDEYIKNYGDRNLEELKLESKTFRTDKNLLLNKIYEYRLDKNKLKSLYYSLNVENKIEIDNKKIKKILEKCKKGIKNREISRLNRSRIFGMVRLIFLKLGEIFVKEKIINDKSDIFYLTVDEVFNLAKNSIYIQEKIENRKKDYEIFKMLPAYSRIIFENKEFNKYHISINSNKKINTNNYLLGIPCSNGIAEGEVVVIENPNEITNCNNKILVTKTTDPGWVFLIATAKGIISEKGSLLSHTAIISRELNIPFIACVENLLNNVKTGDFIKMDGSTGKIEIIMRHN